MSKPMFSEGPWTAMEISDGHYEIFQKSGIKPSPVAPSPLITLDCSHDGCDQFRTVTTPANARLIAAAPEMYDALVSIEEYWNRDPNDCAMTDALYYIIETAQDALNKARGDNK